MSKYTGQYQGRTGTFEQTDADTFKFTPEDGADAIDVKKDEMPSGAPARDASHMERRFVETRDRDAKRAEDTSKALPAQSGQAKTEGEGDPAKRQRED